jgi:hypothetical protein
MHQESFAEKPLPPSISKDIIEVALLLMVVYSSVCASTILTNFASHAHDNILT